MACVLPIGCSSAGAGRSDQHEVGAVHRRLNLPTRREAEASVLLRWL